MVEGSLLTGDSRNLPLQDLELLSLQYLQVPVIHSGIVKQGHHKMLLLIWVLVRRWRGKVVEDNQGRQGWGSLALGVDLHRAPAPALLADLPLAAQQPHPPGLQ